MKKILLSLSLFLLPFIAEAKVTIEWFSPSIVHVVKTDKADYVSPKDVIIPSCNKNVKPAFKVEVQGELVSFYSPTGELLTKESATTAKNACAWTLEADEAIYGLGILQNGKMSQRGIDRDLCPGNTEDGIPFFQSVKGYGIYWNNYSTTHVSDKNNIITFRSETAPLPVEGQGEASEAVDYYFIYGGDADGVVAGIRELTGDAPMFALWTYGFHQSKERYKSQEETCNVLDTYRKEQIPLDGIIQDWQYWGNNYMWNAMEFMSEQFPQPEKMMKHIHDSNAHMSISIWQSFGPHTKAYKELDKKGLLFNIETWPQSGISHIWPPRMDYPSGVRVYDAYSDEARDIYWNNLKRLFDLGIDAWWMDSTEPDHFNPTESDWAHQTAMGPYRNVRNLFPFRCVSGVYDHQRAEANGNDKRVFILTRSGFFGQQRYGCNVWSGDVVSTWDMLRNQIPAGLNFCLTGNPNFNSDLGGFFAGSYNGSWQGLPGEKNPAYHELYVRWMQQGVFTPMMRSHGADVPREIYLYGKAGEPVNDALVGAVKLRYRLLPYIYSTSWQVSKKDSRSTMMRALVMDFRDDKKVHDMASEYMFGKQILATPILKAHYTPEVIRKDKDANAGWDKNTGKTEMQATVVDFSKSTENSFYLPAGCSWYEYNTGKKYDGGQTVSLTTKLTEIPFFVKAGAILPIGPDVQYSTEKKWDNLDIHVYPGANGDFTLYEDEFDNYNYEQGKYTEIRFAWNDKSHTLTIYPRVGSYDGMLSSRTFNIITPDGKQKSVSYVGKKVSVKM